MARRRAFVGRAGNACLSLQAVNDVRNVADVQDRAVWVVIAMSRNLVSLGDIAFKVSAYSTLSTVIEPTGSFAFDADASHDIGKANAILRQFSFCTTTCTSFWRTGNFDARDTFYIQKVRP